MTRRRICVVTGSRAEYGLLAPLLREIGGDDELQRQLVVTGMHLDPRFGNTIDEIHGDGIRPDVEVPMNLSDDTAVGIARAIAQGMVGMSEAFTRLAPDIVVVLGDRFEVLAAAQAALLTRVPIAHCHGGEATEGVIDDAIRHAVTKMAHFHFVAAEPYRRRIIQMGESPERVFTVGALGLDAIATLSLPSRSELEQEIGFGLGESYLLITYHPVTLANDPARGVDELLAALDQFPDQRILFTGANADPGNRLVTQKIDDYLTDHPKRSARCASLGSRRYLAALREAAAVVGNSSSGLIEAPSFAVPTVNIGDRQRGRLRGDSVIDCPDDRAAIASGIRRACDPVFRARLDPARNPYGMPGAAHRIREVLRKAPLDGVLLKRFHDLRAAP